VFPTAAGHFFARDKVAFGADVHFVGVGVTAAAATAAAVVLTLIGAKRRDGRTVLIGAFSVMAALLALHGIATPGIVMADNGVVSFTGGATLPSAARSSRSPRSRSCGGPGTYGACCCSKVCCSSPCSALARPESSFLSSCRPCRARQPGSADAAGGEEAYLGAHVRALMISLSVKDAYTEGHTRRVAL
jgi:hypothetical protein